MYNKQDDTFALKLAKKIKIINLLGGECVKCKNKDINVLEFHHVDEDKIFEIGRKFGLTIDAIKKEAKKCSILCCNCHSEEHYIECSDVRSSQYKVDVLKKLGIDKCKKCGYRGQNLNSLCFHHIDPATKLFNIADFFIRSEGASVERLFEEIEKCEVICRNCHSLCHIDLDRIQRLSDLIKYKINNHKPQPKLDECIIKKLKNEGKGICEIARMLGKNKSSIFYVFHRV